MAGITIHVDPGQWQKRGDQVASDLGKIANKALTDVGFAAIRALKTALDTNLDRPTAFTKQGLHFWIKDRGVPSPTLQVMVRPKQHEYLKHALDGGTASNVFSPTDNTKLDANGNPGRGFQQRILQAGGFWARSRNRGIPTLYSREAKGLKAVGMLLPVVQYQQRMDVTNEVMAVARQELPKAWSRTLSKVNP